VLGRRTGFNLNLFFSFQIRNNNRRCSSSYLELWHGWLEFSEIARKLIVGDWLLRLFQWPLILILYASILFRFHSSSQYHHQETRVLFLIPPRIQVWSCLFTWVWSIFGLRSILGSGRQWVWTLSVIVMFSCSITRRFPVQYTKRNELTYKYFYVSLRRVRESFRRR